MPSHYFNQCWLVVNWTTRNKFQWNLNPMSAVFVWKTHLKGLNKLTYSVQWRYDGRDFVSNQQHRDCLLNRLLRRGSKKASKLRVTGLCQGNLPVTGESPQKWPVTPKMFPFDDVIVSKSSELLSMGIPTRKVINTNNNIKTPFCKGH